MGGDYCVKKCMPRNTNINVILCLFRIVSIDVQMIGNLIALINEYSISGGGY